MFSFSQLFNTTYAATGIPLLDKIQENILNPVITLLFSAAVVWFLYGVFEFVRGQGSDEARKTGAQHILWGVIGMAIMISAYGIINIICGTFPHMGC